MKAAGGQCVACRRRAWREYARSEKGHVVHRRSQARYQTTDKYRAVHRRYEAGLRRGLCKSRYARSREIQQLEEQRNAQDA
jgi:hypothetical protein